jgi:hypothetical protein
MKVIRHILSNFKADWTNHLIGFIATILGILIAFELQDWQETRKENEKLELGIQSLKLEITANRELIKSGLEKFKYFNGYTNLIVRHLKTDSTIIYPISRWDSLISNYPDIFLESNIIKQVGPNDIEIKFKVPVDFFPPKIYTDNWEAVKSSGLLNTFPQDKLVKFIRLYSELNRNWTGSNVDDFLIYVRQHDAMHNNDFNFKEFNRITKDIEDDYRVKLQRIEESYEEIMKY